jgi:phage baseplate assembly protein V
MNNPRQEFQAADAQRAMQMMLLAGEIMEVDNTRTPPSARVRSGGIETDFIPLPDEIGANFRRWRPCRVGTQCLVACPSGDTAMGFIVALYHSESVPAPSTDAGTDLILFEDGTRIEKTGAVLNVNTPRPITVTTAATATVTAATSATVKAPKITLDGDTTVTKTLTVKQLLTYQGGMAGSGGSYGASARVQGNIEVLQGDIKVFGGDILADEISLKNHKHTEQGDGADTSAAKA